MQFLIVAGVSSVCDYALPYHDSLPSNSTIEQVKRVVVHQRLRPQLQDWWNVNETVRGRSREQKNGGSNTVISVPRSLKKRIIG